MNDSEEGKCSDRTRYLYFFAISGSAAIISALDKCCRPCLKKITSAAGEAIFRNVENSKVNVQGFVFFLVESNQRFNDIASGIDPAQRPDSRPNREIAAANIDYI